jgi:CubicO group peptidase (beta-lactamase class C family)
MNSTYLKFLPFLVLIACTNPKEEQPVVNSETELQQKIDNYLLAHKANSRFNGSVYISEKGKPIFEEFYGFSKKAAKAKINSNTKFLIGSITKPFVAACILKLEQDGNFTRQTKLSAFFPDFPKADSVTIEHLLTHTSGISDYHDFDDWKTLSQTDLQPIDVINRVKERPYRFSPGTNFRYCNTGYIFLGLIIEKITGESFEKHLTKSILEPLNLKNTGVVKNDKTIDQLALGYTTTPRGSSLAEYINYNQPFTSGNMYSTTADLEVFCSAIMDSSLLGPRLTRATFEENSGRYGFGWGIRNFNATKAFGHYGGMNGFWGSFTYFPERDLFICFLANDDNTPKYTINKDLVAILSGDSFQIPEPVVFIEPTLDYLRKFEGDYLVKENDTLHVYAKENQLIIRETGQIEYELFPTESGLFQFTMHEYWTRFHETDSNTVDKLIFEGLVNFEARRI